MSDVVDKSVTEVLLQWTTLLLLFPVTFALLLVTGAAFDGCTKCPMESNAQRIALGLQVASFWLLPLGLVTATIGYKLYTRGHGDASRSYLLIFLAATVAFFGGSILESIGSSLRCGKDCLPAHPLAQPLGTLGLYLMALAPLLFVVAYLLRHRKHALRDRKTVHR